MNGQPWKPGRRHYRSPTAFDRLLPNQRDDVQTWLVSEGISYAEAERRIQARFGVAISTSSIYRFFVHVCRPILEKIAREHDPLVLEIEYRVLRGSQLAGQHLIRLPLTKAGADEADKLPPLPEPILKSIADARN